MNVPLYKKIYKKNIHEKQQSSTDSVIHNDVFIYAKSLSLKMGEKNSMKPANEPKRLHWRVQCFSFLIPLYLHCHCLLFGPEKEGITLRKTHTH